MYVTGNASDLLRAFVTAVALLALGAAPQAVRAQAGQTPKVTRPAAVPAFVNRAWIVAESAQVAVGELRVFLSDGTLVMASPHATPALGRWRYRGGQLTITEEGLSYPVDILALDARTFRIRMRGPGEPVVIRFAAAVAPADRASDGAAAQQPEWVQLHAPPGSGPILRITGTVVRLDVEGGQFVIRDADGTQFNPIELPDAFRQDGLAVEVEARRREGMVSVGMVGPLIEVFRVRKAPAPTAPPVALAGTAWQLEDLAGARVLDGVRVTLEVSTGEPRASGRASCNQFGGSVKVAGAALTFGPLISTRMACHADVMAQERAYLAALQDARHFEIKAGRLYIFGAAGAKPLRFARSPRSPKAP